MTLIGSYKDREVYRISAHDYFKKYVAGEADKNVMYVIEDDRNVILNGWVVAHINAGFNYVTDVKHVRIDTVYKHVLDKYSKPALANELLRNSSNSLLAGRPNIEQMLDASDKAIADQIAKGNALLDEILNKKKG